VRDITERKHTEEAKTAPLAHLQQVLDATRMLQEFIRICARCKKIHNEAGQWEEIEGYVEKHTTAKFSHTLCDVCGEQLYGGQWTKAMRRDL
jgi:hypothetical protein